MRTVNEFAKEVTTLYKKMITDEIFLYIQNDHKRTVY
jgi:hypothetical protein